jgi:hypothetical protein
MAIVAEKNQPLSAHLVLNNSDVEMIKKTLRGDKGVRLYI